jgi:hypothetical protein
VGPRENVTVARATKIEKSRVDELWEEYRRIQLTPDQKSAARKELEEQSKEAARNGVWERFLELEGTVHLEYDLEELREDRD